LAHDVDFLIVGSGIAGLRAALALAGSGRVLVLTKAAATESNTGYAQGGIAAAVGADDTPALHAADTVAAGDGLCEEAAVRVLVDEGPRYVRELIDWGARFDRAPGGALALGLEAAHSVRRVLHAGDATGREIGRALWDRVSALRSVETINHALVMALVVENGAVAGARFFDDDGQERSVRAATTLLATGGAGQVFSDTTNPAVATGDGIALAFHAGAAVADLEFVQFHPTALKREGVPRFLMSEALRGEGARLVNGSGEPFMARYHAAGDLAPRDVVARSIVREGERTGQPVFLTLAHLDAERARERFPTIAEMCRQVGLDLAVDLIPVGPAAHYVMGGIATDVWGRTSLPGLYAAGETACTGVHGANRLASNSLLEGLVFGARAAEAMKGARAGPSTPGIPAGWRRALPQRAHSMAGGGPLLPPDAVRALMWRSAGLFRTFEGLADAVARLDRAYAAEVAAAPVGKEGARTLDDWRRFNLLTVARLIARAALRREESRGGHFRSDYPARDDQRWKVHVTDCAGEGPGGAD
jgi:L-aspartate oxidase